MLIVKYCRLHDCVVKQQKKQKVIFWVRFLSKDAAWYVETNSPIAVQRRFRKRI